MGSFWSERRVLVTGGSGFIGYALARKLLDEGARVSILDIRPLPKYATKEEKKALRFVKGSVKNEKIVGAVLKKERIQTVFHLAAEAIVGKAHEAPAEALDTNIRGTWVLLEAIRAAFPSIEVVVASSDKAYGSHAKLPYKEEAPLYGVNPYDVSKSAADLVANSYAKTYGLHLAIARCGNVYGPGDLNWSRLIPDALRCLAKNKTLKLRSNGKYARDYVYIDDIVCAYMVLGAHIGKKKMHGDAYNFGTNSPLTVIEVLSALEKAAGKRVTYSVLDKAHYEIQKQYLDSSKAKERLHWVPAVSRSDGMKRTADWYRGYAD